MFFNSVEEIQPIASKVGCSVFVLPKNMDFEIKNAIMVTPEKTVISIEQVQDLLKMLGTKQKSDRFIIIRPAELLGLEAANALLKSIEEPKDKVHFILVTDSPSKLLPTILSRSSVYFLKTKPSIYSGIDADEDIKTIAKRLMVAKPAELPDLAEEICKVKEGAKERTLLIVGTAIEMLYKSYFITKKDIFIKKIPSFLTLYENVERNGHIKTHIAADLI